MFGQSRSTLSWSIGSCPYRDRDSILTARTLAREEGLLVGGSAGLAVAAGLRIATELTRDHIVVILLPDSGRSYLSKYHNDTWLRRLGFLDDDRDRLRVIDALQRRAAVEEVWLGSTSESGSVSIPSTASIERALDVAAASVSGSAPIPVVLPREPGGLPAAVSEVLGVVSRDTLQTNARANGPELTAVQLAQPVSVFLGTGESCADAVAALDSAGVDRALVLRDGRLAGTVGRDDRSP